MRTKQTIAIIGLGETGKAMARLFSKGSDRILLFDKNEATAIEEATSLQKKSPLFDVEPITCSANACWEADIIIPDVPYNELTCVTNYFKEYANQKIVVSIENKSDTTARNNADILQQLLPFSKIVSVCFNSEKQPVEEHEITLEGKDGEAVGIVEERLSLLGCRILTTAQ